MSTPPSPAILLLSLPPSLLIGIDLLTFTTSARFSGIKNLPPGWHFLYTSETTSHSIRDGFWFHVPAHATPSLVRKWDATTSNLTLCSPAEETKARETLSPETWRARFSPYRQSAGASPDDASREAEEAVEEENGDWARLTEHITPALLARLTSSPTDFRFTSASCGAQDLDHIPGLGASESQLGEQELQFLGIDLKRTWREGAVGRERTEAVLDRSWALGEVEERFKGEVEEGEGDVVLGEMEVCFLMVLTVANYSCLEEWKRILGLVLTCRRAVRAREGWFARFLGILRRQLERGGDVEGGLFDLSDADEGGAYLKGLLKGFKLILGQVFGEREGEDVKGELEDLEAFLRGEYGWELSDSFVRRGMLELEDGEQVEMEVKDMEGEDERGEYAPVVVEL